MVIYKNMKIETIRHSLAHVMAKAVQELYRLQAIHKDHTLWILNTL